MSEIEGVIKYQLHHCTAPLPETFSVVELNTWRSILLKLALIGQDSQRYQGYGFGNLSQRLRADSSAFVISGTQTGQLKQLNRSDYCLVTAADPQRNQIHSQGLCQPSSEALTHASVYAHNPRIQAVIHVHSPDIWRHSLDLKLAHTRADIDYGTPQMARAVADLLATQIKDSTSGLFSMLGHEDGVVAFAQSLTEAAQNLIQQLALALSCSD
jgi:L-ribulose-5-phosphate 4-epimerase